MTYPSLPLKYVASLNDDKLPDSTDPSWEFRYLDIGAVGRGHLAEQPVMMRFGESPSRARRLVAPGDTILSTVRTYLRAVWAVEGPTADLVVSTGFAVVRPRCIEAGFLQWAIQADSFIEAVVARSTGVSYPAINPSDLGMIPSHRPSFDQQRRIADFLDAETARVDALIAAKQRMIEASTERQRAWLSLRLAQGASVPARRLTRLRTSGPRGWADELTSSGSPFVRSQNLSRDSIALRLSAMAYVDPPDTPEASRSRTQAGDVLIGITGANTGWVGLVDLRLTGAYVSQHVAILRPTDDVDPRWLAYSYFSHEGQAQLLGGQYGGTKQQLSLAELADFELRLPDLKTQRTVADAIDRSFVRLTGLTTTLATQVALLRERRQALITAAVTGEIEV